jgi:signal transduction histidine kinase/ActR/RegA family two-component response regulator
MGVEGGRISEPGAPRDTDPSLASGDDVLAPTTSCRATRLEAEAEELQRVLESIVPPPPIDAAAARPSVALIEEVPIGLAELRGRHFVVAVANRAFADLCGAEDAVGRPLGEAAPRAFTHGLADLLGRVEATGREEILRSIRAWGARPSAPERWIDVLAQRHGDSIALVVTDVTRHVQAVRAESARRLEAERRAALLEEERSARAAAEEASRIKDEFLGTLSHELRNPMSAILGWTSVLRRGDRGGGRELDAESRARALGVIERNARAQLRLIEDLLDVSRIVQGKLALSTGPVDLGSVIRGVVDTLRPAADAKGLALQVDLADGACIIGDADRLTQAVLNLVANAIKFTAAGSVHVVLTMDDGGATIRIADTGCGIAADFLPRVFDRFQQADSGATRTAGGLGIGLAIARSLVDLHAGRIAATSEGIGRGATFTVRLPAAPPDWDEPPPSVTPAPMAAASWTSGKLLDGVRVLVVDDDEDARLLAAHLLGDVGAVVTAAGSVREALTEAGRADFDVLVSDVGMPRETGYDLIRALRADGVAAHAALPSLALTAYAREEDRRRALDAGFDGHLAKPIDPAQLVAAVDEARRVRRGRGP